MSLDLPCKKSALLKTYLNRKCHVCLFTTFLVLLNDFRQSSQMLRQYEVGLLDLIGISCSKKQLSTPVFILVFIQESYLKE